MQVLKVVADEQDFVEDTEEKEVETFVLDEDQSKAIKFLKESILEKKPVVALLGAGGTGKTAILHKIGKDKSLYDKKLTFTATTNKAAGIMREKIKSAVTMHSAISTFVPTRLYLEIHSVFDVERLTPINFSKETVEFLKENQLETSVSSISNNYNDADELFRTLGIDGYDPLVFSHYATSDYLGGACFVDESSMLPIKSIYNKEKRLQTIGLDILQGIYDTVVLVGDDSQLPPIQGNPSIENVESANLTINHRSELDLLRLLDYTRKGGAPELFVPKKGENIRVIKYVTDNMFKASANTDLDIVHIVFKNITRQALTIKIRGNDPMPREGEKIVYYGKNINDPGDVISKNEIGVYHDGLGEWDEHNEYIDYRMFDEYPNKARYPKYRYGYVLTCHTAQGSSFDHVIVHTGDIPGFLSAEMQRKWLYTAVSRARKSVTIVR